jgi:pimeloyl-ACP methyl ester carboxylesterase
MTSPRSRRIALATGLTYHVLEWGAQHEHTVVLLHGFLDLGWSWEEVAARLADRYRVLAPDLRGHGDSDWIGPGGYYHFQDYVADVDDLIARLAPGAMSIVGHSMGGSVAAYWAGMRASRPRRVALLEGLGPPDGGDANPDRTARWIDMWKAARTKPQRPMVDIDDAAARMRRHDDQLDEAQARRLAAHGTVAVDGGLRWKHDPLHLTMGPYPFRRDVAESYWKRIAAPVLAVDGDRSAMRHAGAEAERRLASFQDVRRATIADAGHMMQRHQPAALAALLAEFLA